MNIEIKNLKFYEINQDYINFLHSHDSQVYCHTHYDYKIKPYIGILVGLSNKNFFIPLTSPKEKHKKFRLRSKEHLSIYRKVDINENISNAIYKNDGNSSDFKYRIIAILDIKKMIPVNTEHIKLINFSSLPLNYQLLFYEEYIFCKKNSEFITTTAELLYQKTKEKNRRIGKFHCDYIFLETLADSFI